MAKRTLFIFMMLNVGIVVKPQAAFNLSRLSDERTHELLKYMSYVTAERIMAADSVIQIQPQAFKTFDRAQKNFGFSRQYFWLKLTLINDTPIEKQLLLMSGNPALNAVELFRVDSNKSVSLGKAGDYYPFVRRPYIFYTVCFPLTMAAGEKSEFYLFVDKKDENIEFGFGLYEQKRFQRYANYIYFISGTLLGVLLMALLFNFFLFLKTKERLHGWYCLYLVFTIAYLMSTKNLDFEFIVPNAFWTNVSRSFNGNMSMVLLLTVMQSFIVQTRQNSRFYYPVNLIKIALVLCAISGLIIYYLIPVFEFKRAYHFTSTTLLLSGMIMIYISCVEQLRKGQRLALLYMLAVSFISLATIILMFSIVGISDFFYSQPSIMEIGLVLEALAICFAILYRYWLFRKKQEQLTVEVQRQKETLIKSIIAVQESEQKRIAEDLHDELGGNLAAIKMGLQTLTEKQEKLGMMIQLIDNAAENARNISHNLMPPEFEKTPLKDLLFDHYNRLNQKSGIRFHFVHTGKPFQFDKKNELVIYRVIFELTSNILKHSKATEATIQLIYYENELEIMAEDNGVGMSNAQSLDGIGMKNIHSRVQYLNGSIMIDSGRHGTTFMIKIPFKLSKHD